MEDGGGVDTFMESQQDAGSLPVSEEVSSSIFFKGSVADAITSAQTERKILIVFIAGESDESVLMEQTTFQLPEVVNEVQKQSLLLRMQEGSPDAAHFSAIYPLRCVPTITLIGHNGSVLHQLEGYQKAEEFLSILQRAATTFNTQLQRAAAASAMVALLSSANLTLGSPVPGGSEQQLSGNRSDPSLSVQLCPISETQSSSSQIVDTPLRQIEDIALDSNQPDNFQPTEGSRNSPVADSQSYPQAEPSRTESSEQTELVSSPAASTSSSAIKSETLTGKTDTLGHQGNTSLGARQAGRKIPLRRESSGSKQVPVRTGPFLLQIRLTNGETIRGTFESHQLLRDVEQFVDLQRTDGNMAYRLAIPFPRKLLTEEDMGKTLMKLDIGPRSALILIGSHTLMEGSTHTRGSANQVAASTAESGVPGAGGSYVGKFLSYLNPFAYGRIGNSTDQQSSSNMSQRQHNADPAMARALQEGLQPPVPSSSQPQPSFATPYNGGSNQKGDTSQTGSLSQRKSWGVSGNVHTLRQDEEGPSRGNTYWNGNSTQFGGNDEAKED